MDTLHVKQYLVNKNIEGDRQLIEAGFEYIIERDGYKI
jgi:hypothetical protein